MIGHVAGMRLATAQPAKLAAMELATTTPRTHRVVHTSFQLMVAIASVLLLMVAWYWWRRRRGRDPLESSRFLRVAVVAGPLSVLALQAGWMTTEVGRQPWIVQGVLRVEDAVTSNGGIWITFSVVALLYAGLAVATTFTLRSMSRRWRKQGGADLPTPYGLPANEGTRSGQPAGRR